VKRALVAGAAGFIGSHLCDLLLDKGYEVVGLDNLVTGRRVNLEPALKRGLRLLEHNLIDGIPTIDGPLDEIYNLASPASPVDFAKMPLFILETASRGHRHLLDLAKAKKARILFASTSEVYGDPEVHPQVETYFGNVNSIGARSCYDEAKRYGEALTMAYHREHGVQTRIVRTFNTYGPRMRPDDGRIIPNFFIQALQGESLTVYGEGKQTRSFCYVSDQAEGMWKLMISDEKRPVNVGNPLERTVLEIANAVNALCGNSAPLRHLPLPENDPKMRCPVITRAAESIGWSPRVGLEEGLAQCLTYFREELARAGSHGIKTPTV
jgi:dTDP-glucose 4,6-dehydratase